MSEYSMGFFSDAVDLLSFFVVKINVGLPEGAAGQVWHNDFRSQSQHHLHRHDELELNLVIQGQATYLLRERKYSLHPGDAIWLFPAQDHILVNRSPDFKMWIVVWKPQTILAASNHEANQILRMSDPEGNFHHHLSEGQMRRLTSLCAEISSSETDCQNAGLAYLLLRAWAEFNATDRVASGEGIHPSVEGAARLLRDGEDVSLVVLARKVGLSPSRLSRLFKEQTGVPISEFRNRERLERFFHIYRQGKHFGLSEAALEAGFGSYAQFYRVFKRASGHNPADFYREGNLPEHNAET